ncbi:MAG: AAA family ATPase [Verrucomicrobia bacterium]|jgi:predicted ATPase|nr:AAA family ATPase [Verrucomicrobiota bacterium]
MLEELNIKNFKSYREATLPLGPLTLLIGANASGKSNAIEAIRFLNWLAKGSRLDDIEKDVQKGDSIVRGQSSDLFRSTNESFCLGTLLSGAPGKWNDFEVSIGRPFENLVLTGESVSKEKEKVPLYQIDSQPSEHSDEVSVLYNNFKRGKNKPHIPCSCRQAIFYQLETPGRFGKDHKESQKTIPDVTRFIRETLRGTLFLDPRPAGMRDWAYPEDEIDESGKNVSGVLHKIIKKQGRHEEVLNFIRSLPEQDITNISFLKTERGEVMVQLEETFGKNRRPIDAPLLSDGSLRVLSIAAALLSAKEGTLVIIEEIDNGVHPSRAKTLIEQVEKVAKERNLRVLLSTHNPALLNAVPVSALADVVCCYRDPDMGDSKLVKLGDLDRYPELVAQGPLGDLVTSQILDRFLKDKRSPEEVKQSSLNWLNQYASSAKEDEA